MCVSLMPLTHHTVHDMPSDISAHSFQKKSMMFENILVKWKMSSFVMITSNNFTCQRSGYHDPPCCGHVKILFHQHSLSDLIKLIHRLDSEIEVISGTYSPSRTWKYLSWVWSWRCCSSRFIAGRLPKFSGANWRRCTDYSFWASVILVVRLRLRPHWKLQVGKWC